MATIAELLARLERDAFTLGPPDTEAGPDAHAAGWMLLANRTQHAVSQLPLGGRPEKVGIGLRTVLQPLADGPRRGRPAEALPIPALAQLALTMGAINDVLADTLRARPRPEYVGREAAKLEASLLAPVHLAARWSRAGLENQEVRRNRISIRGMLDNLAAVTEHWALIPPANRGSALDDFRIRTVTAPGFEGAATAWADEALLVLTERHRITGWAMQAVAGQLGLISQTAYEAVQLATKDGRLPDAERPAFKPLAGAVTAWRAAVTWPPYLRLGGTSPELRALSDDMQHRLLVDPPWTISGIRNLLALALPVADAHVTAMSNLIDRHELWVHGPSLGPSAGYIPGWAREPWWSSQGLTLLRTARIGHEALDRASVALAVGPGEAAPRSLPLGWPPIGTAFGVPSEHRGSRASAIQRGVNR